MDSIISIGFEKINFNINFSKEGIRKGKEIVEAKHLFEIQELRSSDCNSLISCKCHKTTQPTSTIKYKVHLEVSILLKK